MSDNRTRTKARHRFVDDPADPVLAKVRETPLIVVALVTLAAVAALIALGWFCIWFAVEIFA